MSRCFHFVTELDTYMENQTKSNWFLSGQPCMNLAVLRIISAEEVFKIWIIVICARSLRVWSIYFCIARQQLTFGVFFCQFFGIDWVIPNNIKEAYESYCSWRIGISIKKTWAMVPGSIFWCIWNKRNRRCFDGILNPNHTLKPKCLYNLFSWFNQTPVTSTELFLDFVCSFVVPKVFV